MRLGIDLGGTKTEAAVINDDGVVVWRHRIPSERQTYKTIIQSIKDLTMKAENETGFQGNIGIAIPGQYSPSLKVIKGASLTLLNDKDFVGDVSMATNRMVRVSNDANCFALSEAINGAGVGYDTVLGIILGTGCGSGIVAHGKLLAGAHGIAGEFGHTPLPWPLEFEYDGHDCWCGKTGCLETYISGPAMAKDYESRTNETLTAKEITERTHIDLTAESVVQVYEDRLGRALAQIINILDPDVIVLGGGLSNLDRLYQNVPRKWKNLVFSKDVQTPLLKAKHGDSSGVIGAAWLWPNYHGGQDGRDGDGDH